uniref:Transcription initiation factor TFIID subunit 12 n=1 Tax=Eptatretus burgeri TaxID=7764 RepID=A0A8C4QE50_EPTBU
MCGPVLVLYSEGPSVPVEKFVYEVVMATVPVSTPVPISELLRDLDTQIALLGPGPHSVKQRGELQRLAEMQSGAQALASQLGRSALVSLPSLLAAPAAPPTALSAAPTALSAAPTAPPAASTPTVTVATGATGIATGTTAAAAATGGAKGQSGAEGGMLLSRRRLQELAHEVDPNEQLDDDVEELLLQMADDFIESVVSAASQLARHRKSTTLDVRDLQLHLERQWNMWIPGFGAEEVRPFRKSLATEAHKQRLALIRKTTKK